MFPTSGAQANPPESMDTRRQRMMGAAILGGPGAGGPAAPSPAAGNAAKKLIVQKMGDVANAISEVLPAVEQTNPALMPLLHMMVKVGMRISSIVDGGGEAPGSDAGEAAAGGAAMS